MGILRRLRSAAPRRAASTVVLLAGMPFLLDLLATEGTAQDRAPRAADGATADSTATPTAIESGPRPGEMPALRCSQPAGTGAGTELDVAALFREGSGAVLFVHELTRNVAPVVRALDQLADTHAPLGFDSVTILLAADRNAAERQAEAASRSITLTRPLTVSVDGAEGPGAWALNRRASLTLVTVRDGHVVESIGFTDTGARDEAQVRAMIERATGALPDDPAELRRLAIERLPQDTEVLRARAARSALLLHWQALMRGERDRRMAQRGGAQRGDADGAARMRGPADAPREGQGRDTEPARPARPRVGAPPEDAELQGLLRRAIRRTADDAELDAVFAAIDARVEAVPDTESQAVEMLRLMLSLDYGTESARRRAATWVKEHGGEVPAARGGDDEAREAPPPDAGGETPSRRRGR